MGGLRRKSKRHYGQMFR